MGYNLLINGVYWGYNPPTNHLVTSWDIQVLHHTATLPNGMPRTTSKRCRALDESLQFPKHYTLFFLRSTCAFGIYLNKLMICWFPWRTPGFMNKTTKQQQIINKTYKQQQEKSCSLLLKLTVASANCFTVSNSCKSARTKTTSLIRFAWQERFHKFNHILY